MKICDRCSLLRLAIVSLLLSQAAGCAPAKYLSTTGRELVLEREQPQQSGGIDPSVAKRCLEGDTAVYKKLFGDRYNPCAELGVFLINNSLPDEGIAYFEKGITAEASYNASLSNIDVEQLGVLQKTRLANFLFDLCLNKKVKNLHDGKDITGDICAQAGTMFEKVKYQENAIMMYRKKCELTGKCDDLTRLGVPVKR
jgi:hypothetical protein